VSTPQIEIKNSTSLARQNRHQDDGNALIAVTTQTRGIGSRFFALDISPWTTTFSSPQHPHQLNTIWVTDPSCDCQPAPLFGETIHLDFGHNLRSPR
jgi:hypothetical protein